ncbi:TauD/TfdA family dioxygenase [Streptomyces sp. SCA3-4]|uniref:TauD/TfdA family dioxygenase n=1 Tax=Streptomyces sichuanensis TaxID=2871810 RepID=UPI001CE357B8|nr:TauD/TfdA family dioxygenase [Streptomyces sichuanensis]MCA6095485.1 TauD/TfdA family dioxygenase [Streptomyces sichuanensis]
MTTLSEIDEPSSAGTILLALSEAERHDVAVLARELAATAPAFVDDPRWLSQARHTSCRLPLRMREVLRGYRHDPGPDGILVIRHLPVSEMDLPRTPIEPDSVERVATEAAAVAVMISLQIGEIAAYRDEKSGALVQNVVPVPGREESQSNAGSIPLELHVENAFHPHRPDYVGLLCLRDDHSGTAGTLVSSIRATLRLLPTEAVRVLQDRRFTTAPPPSFRGGDAAAAHAVLTGDPADPNVKVDFHATSPCDDEAKWALELLRSAFLDASQNLVLKPGDMAFVDNRIAIHGRTAYTPRYDGRDRWLHRTFVHLDHRRTRGHRPDNGYVLL